eukprot:Skav222182  [mRNA]  locus=scaffold3784:62750:63130:- [translate_table: standard]
MQINLDAGVTVKPMANAMDHQLPDDEFDENSPRALFDTDSPAANRVLKLSPKIRRRRRTASVVVEEMQMWEAMRQPVNASSRWRCFGAEDVYPVHLAAYFGDVASALWFLNQRSGEMKRVTSEGRG